jgi:LuxR family maltose regulon positive regulatory protein
VEARLRLPASRHGLVVRAELLVRLLGARDVGVVLIAAGAGFGKTTLLVQWAERDHRPFAWVSLDGTDDDPDVLLADVGRALGAIGVDAGEEPLSLPRLAADADCPFVLVLDDAHRLGAPRSLALVSALVDNLPPGCQIAIAGRSEPALPLARWSVQGDLLRLDAEHLAMTLDEAGVLLDPEGELAAAELDARVRSAEGWPAALSIAGRLRGDGAAGLVADYLRDEVLTPLGTEMSRFLTGTAVLDRLCGPLCDAVLERAGSGALLRRIARVNLFVRPVAGRRGWYRCHPLLRDVLRAELAQHGAELVARLHGRASQWFEAGREVGEAIRHARAAGDAARAADLIWARLRPLPTRRELDDLDGWIDGFEDGALAAQPALALAAAWRGLGRGDVAAAERWAAAAENGPGCGRLPGGAAVLRALAAAEGLARMAEDAAQGRAAEGAASGWRALCDLLAGAARRLEGDGPGARASLAAAERTALAAGDPAVLVRSLAQRAALAADEGCWQDAAALLARARAVSEWEQPASDAGLVELGAVSALVLARLGQTAIAGREARRCRELLATAAYLPPWLHADCRVQLARASLLVGDAAAAHVLLREARAVVARMPDFGVLGDRLEETCRQAEAFPLAGVVAPAALSRAELRVLRYLPTHLSYREIGERLHVSRCTVKSQALSAYRKLDVSSRSQAVERAMALGLVPAFDASVEPAIGERDRP